MNDLMTRLEKYVGIPILVCGAIFVAFWLWSATYALTAWLSSPGHTYTILRNDVFNGHFLEPYQQVRAMPDNPTVRGLAISAAKTTLLELIALALAGVALVLQPWRDRPPAGGARFATMRDLRKAGMLGGEPGKSVLLGTFKGKDVRYSGDSHFYVNGPSRSGKGRGFIMPNLLEWKGSAIILDVKRENLEKTGAARLALGQRVFELAPGSERSHRWNPLDFIRPWPSRATDLQNLAATLIPVPDKGESIWGQTARDLLSGMVGYVTDSAYMEGRRTLRSVLRLFNEGDLATTFQDIVEREPHLNSFILDAFRRHIARDPRQRPSFEGNITTALKAWNNRLIADMTSASDFDIGELRRRPYSVFISAPVSDFGTVEPMIRLFIQQVHDVLLRTIPGKDEPHKVILMLDEFYQFQRLPEIINRAPLVAGYGFRIALVAQNIPQVDERYSKATREALLGNMDIKLVVAVGDKATGDVISDAMGRHFVERSSWSTSRQSGGFGTHRSEQGRWDEVPLMTADQLQRLDDKKTVLNIRGTFSATLDKLNFYTDARFRRHLKSVSHFEPFVVTPLLEPVEEWPLFANRPALAQTALAQTALTHASKDVPEFIKGLAARAFVDWGDFVDRRVQPALNADDDDKAVVELSRLLRSDPAKCGRLLGAKDSIERRKALDICAMLRRELIALRISWNREVRIPRRSTETDTPATPVAVAKTPPDSSTATPPAATTVTADAPALVGTVARETALGSGANESLPAIEEDLLASVADAGGDVTALAQARADYHAAALEPIGQEM